MEHKRRQLKGVSRYVGLHSRQMLTAAQHLMLKSSVDLLERSYGPNQKGMYDISQEICL